ncbi:hypothetical protein DPMN_113158 [Dreissena polymorpha]|uniref:Uncharacterized protein n=1 Tax=Dreissena polymorpha TaxID=45954 RepID=A0A9D4KHU0_DREPO|nr:hypothetical protein DPMN_113158 [Dreissena polymorpha]
MHPPDQVNDEFSGSLLHILAVDFNDLVTRHQLVNTGTTCQQQQYCVMTCVEIDLQEVNGFVCLHKL